MALPNKKIVESIVLDLFQKAFADFPKGNIEKSESPDFLVKVNTKKTIGIELTELILNNSKKKQDFLELIDLLIHKKEEKIILYRKKKCQQLWLIIYADFIESKNANSLDHKLYSMQHNSAFNRLFLFDVFNHKIFDLLNGAT